jgi:hypothetical protein
VVIRRKELFQRSLKESFPLQLLLSMSNIPLYLCVGHPSDDDSFDWSCNSTSMFCFLRAFRFLRVFLGCRPTLGCIDCG